RRALEKSTRKFRLVTTSPLAPPLAALAGGRPSRPGQSAPDALAGSTRSRPFANPRPPGSSRDAPSPTPATPARPTGRRRLPPACVAATFAAAGPTPPRTRAPSRAVPPGDTPAAATARPSYGESLAPHPSIA